MAEVVGVISGSLTLAGVVTSLADSIIKLKDCWDQIREAPDDLRWMVREIEVFGRVLVDMRADITQESTASILLKNRPMLDSLEMCVEATRDLDRLISDLGRGFKSQGRLRRSYAAAKVVMQKNQIEKFRSRLQNMTRLLSLCQQCYTR